MNRRRTFALGGATLALALTPAAAIAAKQAGGATTVTVRVEGVKRTLLERAVVHTHAGSITKGGAPSGKCPSTSAAGALDTATHHRWAGKWYGSFNDYLISRIRGEAATGTKYYWAIWVNDRFATTGACEIKLRKGDQLLFAVDSVKKHEHPIGIEAPRTASVGKTFDVKVVSFSDTGKATPLPGARLSIAGHTFPSDKHGIVPLKTSHAGTYSLSAGKTGYIRAATASVRVG